MEIELNGDVEFIKYCYIFASDWSLDTPRDSKDRGYADQILGNVDNHSNLFCCYPSLLLF